MFGRSKRAKKPEAPPPATRAGRIWKGFKGWVVAFAMAFAILGPIRSSIADWNDVPTGSMEPTILPGDRIFVNKLAYGLRLPFTSVWLAEWGDPKPGDIVTFFSPEDGQRLVKRIIAGPGDTIELRDNVVYVNGSRLEYGPMPTTLGQIPTDPRTGPQNIASEFVGGRRHAVMETPAISSAMRSFGPVEVPKGHYFMLGDNRDISKDSRFIGAIPRAKITGRSPAVALSVNPKNYYMPRLSRFFKSLH